METKALFSTFFSKTMFSIHSQHYILLINQVVLVVLENCGRPTEKSDHLNQRTESKRVQEAQIVEDHVAPAPYSMRRAISWKKIVNERGELNVNV